MQIVGRELFIHGEDDFVRLLHIKFHNRSRNCKMLKENQIIVLTPKRGTGIFKIAAGAE
jgi:hypothetical protein